MGPQPKTRLRLLLTLRPLSTNALRAKKSSERPSNLAREPPEDRRPRCRHWRGRGGGRGGRRAPPHGGQPGTSACLPHLSSGRAVTSVRRGPSPGPPSPTTKSSGLLGDLRPRPRPQLRDVWRQGSPGQEPGAEDPRGAGPWGETTSGDLGFQDSGSPPHCQPRAERRGGPGPRHSRRGSPTPLTWLGCSACSEDAIFLRPD